MARINGNVGKLIGAKNVFLWIMEPTTGLMKTNDLYKTGYKCQINKGLISEVLH